LVPAHEGLGYSELLEAGQEPKPGIRTQIAVTDYDGDGKLDVLVGDFCTYLHVKKDLTASERQELAKLRDQQDQAAKGLREEMEALQKQFAELMKGVPRSDWHTPANVEKWRKSYQEMQDSAAYKAKREEYERVQRLLPKFVAGPHNTRGRGPDVPHGYVWLFKRK
jgi:hypothetical protein